METRLLLLMDDGPRVVAFRPKLTGAQYDALLRATEISKTRVDMEAAARQLAAEWGIEVVVDGL
jgi:hypothetical protein